MGYENCGRPEQYPYDVLFDGKPHVIAADDEGPMRAMRIAAYKRGLLFYQHKIGKRLYMMIARVDDGRLSSENSPGSQYHICARGLCPIWPGHNPHYKKGIESGRVPEAQIQ